MTLKEEAKNVKEMKHTPGPLKLLIEGDEDTCIVRTIVIDGKSRNLSEVALVTTGSMSDEVEAANAKLIAAAPEMLEALEHVCKFFERNYSVPTNYHQYRTAKEAIKKATE